MSKITGFLEIDRRERKYAAVSDRVRHWHEFVIPLSEDALVEQATRCMDCGIPYCHNGCPINNQIPDFNTLVYEGDWRRALDNLHETNNFPEFTGRICPAPCEAACTLNLTDAPVTIKTIECAIIDKGWEMGWITPVPALVRREEKIAVVGSGPAGLTCAQQLARLGYGVDVYEKNHKAGGLLRYGIPDFKLEKHHIDRRLEQMEAEGVTFYCETAIGTTKSLEELRAQYDAVVLAIGAEAPRDLKIPNRDLTGIYFAMDYLCAQNRRNSNEFNEHFHIHAAGKRVVVIGGGDTGSDCIGTAIRQGAISVTQLEIMPEPPLKENKLVTWPHWPLKLRVSSSLEEGASRSFSVRTRAFSGKDGRLTALVCEKLDGALQPIPGSEFTIEADLVFLAMGFVSPLVSLLGAADTVKTDGRGSILASPQHFETSLEGVYACGDARRGQSLVVWAINEGRTMAAKLHKKLAGKNAR